MSITMSDKIATAREENFDFLLSLDAVLNRYSHNDADSVECDFDSYSNGVVTYGYHKSMYHTLLGDVVIMEQRERFTLSFAEEV